MIQAKVIADSKNEFGNRITTMVVTFPRFILAEFNTHRMFSRNSASSRAIPFEKVLKSVQETPFIPMAWQKDHKGMQGTEYFNHPDLHTIEHQWLMAKDEAVRTASILSIVGVTKQLCNRLLEPFMYHTCIVTATEWENFFALRCPQYVVNVGGGNRPEDDVKARSWKDLMKNPYTYDFATQDVVERLSYNKGQAEIHMMALAEAMWDAYNKSTPKQLKAGEWHIPFGDKYRNDLLGDLFDPSNPSNTEIMEEEWNNLKIKIATARCARVSYTVVGEEGREPNYDNDIKLHDRLAKAGHWSPFEHCARAMNYSERQLNLNGKGRTYFCPKEFQYREAVDMNEAGKGWSGNLRGFIQYRKTFANENIQ